MQNFNIEELSILEKFEEGKSVGLVDLSRKKVAISGRENSKEDS